MNFLLTETELGVSGGQRLRTVSIEDTKTVGHDHTPALLKRVGAAIDLFYGIPIKGTWHRLGNQNSWPRWAKFSFVWEMILVRNWYQPISQQKRLTVIRDTKERPSSCSKITQVLRTFQQTCCIWCTNTPCYPLIALAHASVSVCWKRANDVSVRQKGLTKHYSAANSKTV